MEFTVQEKKVFAAVNRSGFDSARRSLVFVHGSGMDHTVWVLPRRHFDRHGYNVLAPDLPGHGRSGGPVLASVEAMADWLVETIDQLGLQEVTLIGHSLGSLVTLQAASFSGPWLRSLVLIGCTTPLPVTDILLNAAKDDPDVAFSMINTWGHSKSAQLGGNETPGMWMLGSGYRLLQRSGPDVLYTDLNACNAYQAGSENAASIAVPVLLIQGRQDIMTPVRASAELQQRLSRPRVVTLEDCGHAIMAEQPERLLDCLIDFIM